jgi:hypothetical protein
MARAVSIRPRGRERAINTCDLLFHTCDLLRALDQIRRLFAECPYARHSESGRSSPFRGLVRRALITEFTMAKPQSMREGQVIVH